jgi:glutathione synthase/RimK-type ligase-like ATP-grasp enzyme
VTPHCAPAKIDFDAAARQAARLPGLTEPGAQLLASGKIDEALGFYETLLNADPVSREAHAGLYHAYRALGDNHRAASHLGLAMRWPAVLTLPFRGNGAPVPVLLLLSMNAGNVLIQRFLNDRIFQTYVLIVEFYSSSVVLPFHRLIVNGIGDADVRSQALTAAAKVLAQSPAPVINAPAHVFATSRCGNAQRLGRIPGVLTPRTAAFPRRQLESADAVEQLARRGFEFPVLVRAPGYHMGKNFVRIGAPSGLPAAIAALPGDELIAIQYLDGRGPAGNIRKYRVLTIGGKLYPVHLAIAAHWKIHYFSADMADRPEHRAEEARFLSNMAAVLGPKAIAALTRIQEALGLDYAGVDFGLNAQGEVLLYEANATMAAVRPDADPRWNYRRPAVERIYAAVQELFLARALAA